MRGFSNTLSRIFGTFANTKFPTFLQNIINKMYVKFLKLDMSEFDKISSYKSLNELFTRKLLQKRHIGNEIISPCDSLISAFGNVNDDIAFQIKGFAYNIKELLLNLYDNNLKDMIYINFYLSPKDYHRYHAPLDFSILNASLFAGYLYPVNFKYLNKVSSLFCKNERVVLKCKNQNNEIFYLVFVGALNVGKMKFCFDENIQTNLKNPQNLSFKYENLNVKKGDLLGYFEMGSTIVMIYPKRNFLIKNLQKVKFGENILQA